MSISKKTVRVWFEIHKWTSLICTVFLLLLCLTGLPLIFHEEIEHLMGEAPEAIVMPADTPKMALDSIVAKAKHARPDEVVRFVILGGDLPNVITVIMADSIDAPPDNANLVSMDDRSGEVLAQPKFNEGFMYIMFKLHVDLFAGIPGKLFLGFMGLLFVVAIISGLMLYSPIMRKYNFGMVRTEKSPRIKWLDLHNVLGVVTVAWALVVGLTGVINTTSDIVLGMWQQGQLAEMIAPYKDAKPLTGEYSSLDTAVDVALAAAPGMSTSIVAFPGTVFTSKHHYAVFVKGQTPLTERLVKPALIDAKNGELTDMRAMPWYINAIFISQPLHFGDYGGLPLKILWTIFDLITIVVLISGLYLWVVRRKAQSAQITRLEELEEEKTLEPAI
ncbi:PepSY domain-containing protein [Reichenbachiella carrageenanivorans]|uniref:PepSY domain-containing protein n=1 Tax=Reichenbachiella carrageenanivorans TaxID=2979869 RepID=A0ABY6CZ25_9BACT|nr:PepSY domain-containing protein [Reichenbachiella carrageenanivorans]UXX78664.1 PepSY domain-containing protein [Reichenbachiella carrageenanivorans]